MEQTDISTPLWKMETFRNESEHNHRFVVPNDLIQAPRPIILRVVSSSRAQLRIVLADDHQLFREGLGATLHDAGMTVVGEGADGSQALALAGELAPDLLVLDLGMGPHSGIEALRRLARAHPAIRVVIVTVSAERRDVLEALDAGACGYLLKDTPLDQLALSIRQAAEGQIVLSSYLADALRVHAHAGTLAEDGRETLTPRETEVLRMIADGADNDTIGQALSISPHTVKQYVRNIFDKLGVRSRLQAAVHAVRVGIV
jgi:DNA-binding NarL/FixJ family response regulator